MTAPVRLKYLDPALRDLIDRADESGLRRATLAAISLALRHAGVDDPRAHAGLHALLDTQYGNSPECRESNLLVGELDEAVFDAKDRVDNGSAPKIEYRRAFAKARAASAVVILDAVTDLRRARRLLRPGGAAARRREAAIGVALGPRPHVDPALVEERFRLPALTRRDAAANPMLEVFNFEEPAFMKPPSLPAATVDPVKATACGA
ncbi:MAG: hypothetical protein M3082_02010 [Candidatus Dormibacteraeota bacterium]|nr:hypothetical protein [Candidatus Dormibacteraeota bacterium]